MLLVADKTDIPKHVTLSPFWGWISAAECLRRYQVGAQQIHGCSGNAVLTLAGVIEVDKKDAKDYCENRGCGDHTIDVLDCIHSVKRDFRFANNAKPLVVSNAITNACKTLSAISQANYTSSAKPLFACGWISFLSTVASMILIMMMKI